MRNPSPLPSRFPKGEGLRKSLFPNTSRGLVEHGYNARPMYSSIFFGIFCFSAISNGIYLINKEILLPCLPFLAALCDDLKQTYGRLRQSQTQPGTAKTKVGKRHHPTPRIQLSARPFVCPHFLHASYVDSHNDGVGHTAGAPEGREGRS